MGLIETLWQQRNKQYSQMEELLAIPGGREPNVVELPPMVCWTLWRVVPCWPWYARASWHQLSAVTLHISFQLCVNWHHVGSWKFSMVEHLHHRNWKTPYMRFLSQRTSCLMFTSTLLLITYATIYIVPNPLPNEAEPSVWSIECSAFMCSGHSLLKLSSHWKQLWIPVEIRNKQIKKSLWCHQSTTRTTQFWEAKWVMISLPEDICWVPAWSLTGQ